MNLLTAVLAATPTHQPGVPGGAGNVLIPLVLGGVFFFLLAIWLGRRR